MSCANLLALQDEDVAKMLVANAHLGSQNLHFQMEKYIFKRTRAGMYKQTHPHHPTTIPILLYF